MRSCWRSQKRKMWREGQGGFRPSHNIISLFISVMNIIKMLTTK